MWKYINGVVERTIEFLLIKTKGDSKEEKLAKMVSKLCMYFSVSIFVIFILFSTALNLKLDLVEFVNSGHLIDKFITANNAMIKSTVDKNTHLSEVIIDLKTDNVKLFYRNNKLQDQNTDLLQDNIKLLEELKKYRDNNVIDRASEEE